MSRCNENKPHVQSPHESRGFHVVDENNYTHTIAVDVQGYEGAGNAVKTNDYADNPFLRHKMKENELTSQHVECSSDDELNSMKMNATKPSVILNTDINEDILNNIEIQAQYLATSVDNLMENLCNLLNSISSITADTVEVYRNSVNKLTDSMDANIKSMYTIMAKTEEVTKSMLPTERLANRIREIKRLVDMLDNLI